MPEPAATGIAVGVAGRPETAALVAVAEAFAASGLDRAALCLIVADGAEAGAPLDTARAAVAAGCEVVRAAVEPPAPGDLPYHGAIGRSGAIRAVVSAARDRQASAVAFVGADLGTFPPDWIPALVRPAATMEIDYVSPHYRRAPFEGAITRSIVYPMFRAMYGLRVRQPAAAEFGASARFQQHLIDLGLWDLEGADSGIDLWLATAAAGGGFRLGETLLGARPAAPAAVAPDLSVTIAQLVGALFNDLERRDAVWQRIRGSVPVPVVGEVTDETGPDRDQDPAPYLESFRLGYSALRDVWAWVVPPRAILDLKRASDRPPDQFRLDDDLWARIVYDFAVAYRGRGMPRDHLLRALTPLYLGWLASFLTEMRGRTAADADGRQERLCAAFEQQKPYLVSRWRLPDRFRV